MKKIFFLFLILPIFTFADTPFKHEIRLGYDLSDKTFMEDNSYKHKNNFELSFETMTEIYYNLDFGIGISFRRQSEAENVDYFENNPRKEDLGNFIPIYTTFKYRFPRKKISPFIKLNLGYSINSSASYMEKYNYSIKNSLYYAFGTGLEYNNIIFDISYQLINYKAKGNNGDLNCSNNRTTLSFGYQFE